MRKAATFLLLLSAAAMTRALTAPYFLQTHGVDVLQVEQFALAGGKQHIAMAYKETASGETSLRCLTNQGALHSTATLCSAEQTVVDMRAELGTAGTHDAYWCGYQDTASGKVFVAGKSNESGPQWSYTHPASATPNDSGIRVELFADRVYILANTFSSAGKNDIVLLILRKSDGAVLATGGYAGSGGADDVAKDVAIDTTGNAYIAGSSTVNDPARNSLLVRVTGTGVTAWRQLYGFGNQADGFNSVAVAGNMVYVAGFMQLGTAPGARDGVLYKISPAGATLWQRVMNESVLDVECLSVKSINDKTVGVALTSQAQSGVSQPESMSATSFGEAGNGMSSISIQDGQVEYEAFAVAPLGVHLYLALNSRQFPQQPLQRWLGVLTTVGATPVGSRVPLPDGDTSRTKDISVAPDLGSVFAYSRQGQGQLRKLYQGLKSFQIQEDSVYSGLPATATVTIAEEAAVGGTIFGISANKAGVIPNAYITVPEGLTQYTFPLTVSAVDNSADVHVFAGAGMTSFSEPLTVLAPRIAEFSVTPTVVFGNALLHANVSLEGKAGPSGYLLDMVDNSTAVSTRDLTIPHGGNSVNFRIAVQAVSGSQTAAVGVSHDPHSASVGLTLHPGISTFAVSPDEAAGNSNATGSLTMTGPSSIETTIEISDDTTALTTPSSVSLRVGATSRSFSIGVGQVTSTVTRNVYVKLGQETRSDSIIIQPSLRLSGFTLSSSAVYAGDSLTGTVTLSSAAPAGVDVQLTDTSDLIQTPSAVAVATGQTSATTTIGTSEYSSAVTRSITASQGGVWLTRSLTLQPRPFLSALTLSPSTVQGGGTVTGTVTLTAPPLAGGKSVDLTDNSSVITTPPSVLVPAGSTSATFTVATSRVTATATRQVTALADGISRTENLTLTP